MVQSIVSNGKENSDSKCMFGNEDELPRSVAIVKSDGNLENRIFNKGGPRRCADRPGDSRKTWRGKGVLRHRHANATLREPGSLFFTSVDMISSVMAMLQSAMMEAMSGWLRELMKS